MLSAIISTSLASITSVTVTLEAVIVTEAPVPDAPVPEPPPSAVITGAEYAALSRAPVGSCSIVMAPALPPVALPVAKPPVAVSAPLAIPPV